MSDYIWTRNLHCVDERDMTEEELESWLEVTEELLQSAENKRKDAERMIALRMQEWSEARAERRRRLALLPSLSANSDRQ